MSTRSQNVSDPSAPSWDWLATAAGALGVALMITAIVVGTDAPTALDSSVHDRMAAWAATTQWAAQLAATGGTVTGPLPTTVVVIVVVLALGSTGRTRAGILLAGSAFAGIVIAQSAKLMVGRTRPAGAAEYVTQLDQSYPSGHAMAGIYAYCALGVIVLLDGRQPARRTRRVLGLCLMLLGVCIGLSRIMLGVHWTTDVLAGWAFGLFSLALAAAVSAKVQARRGRPPPIRPEGPIPTRRQARLLPPPPP